MNDMSPAKPAPGATTGPLVRVEDLKVTFVSREESVSAVNGINFELKRGEVMCVIGESGSGKSVMMRALMRLHPPKRTVIEGTMEVDGHDIQSVPERQMRKLRGSTVSMIFQEPMTALDPLYTVGEQIAETVRLLKAPADAPLAGAHPGCTQGR